MPYKESTQRGQRASTRAFVMASAALGFMVPCIVGAAPAGPIYELRWAGVSPGGGGTSSGGAFEATGTIGQAAAEKLTGSEFVSSGGAWPNNIPIVCGDYDADGDVDLTDFARFTQCFGGSFNPPAKSCGEGVDADCDQDGDVDLSDFALFTQNFTGSL